MNWIRLAKVGKMANLLESAPGGGCRLAEKQDEPWQWFGYGLCGWMSISLSFIFLNIEHRTLINDFWFIFDLIILSSVLYNLLRWIIFWQTNVSRNSMKPMSRNAPIVLINDSLLFNWAFHFQFQLSNWEINQSFFPALAETATSRQANHICSHLINFLNHYSLIDIRHSLYYSFFWLEDNNRIYLLHNNLPTPNHPISIYHFHHIQTFLPAGGIHLNFGLTIR